VLAQVAFIRKRLMALGAQAPPEALPPSRLLEDLRAVRSRLEVLDTGRATQDLEEGILPGLQAMSAALTKARQGLPRRGAAPPRQLAELTAALADLEQGQRRLGLRLGHLYHQQVQEICKDLLDLPRK